MSIQRYILLSGALLPKVEGSYVTYEDHAKLLSARLQQLEELNEALEATRNELQATGQDLAACQLERDWLLKHAGVEWHGWWSSRIEETPEPLRSQMKALLYPEGYPSERRLQPQSGKLDSVTGND